MTPAKCFHLTTQLKIPAYIFITKNPKTIDYSNRIPGPFHDLVRREVEVRLVRNGQDQCVDPFQGFLQVFLHPDFGQVILVAEKP